MAGKVAAILALAANAMQSTVAEPLISPDLFHHTVGLFQEAYNTAYEKAGIDEMLAKMPVDDAKKFMNEQYKAVDAHIPPSVWEAYSDAQIQATQAKGTIYTYATKAYEEADQRAKAAVHYIESWLPQTRKGMIAASLGGLVMFTLWMTLVIYIQYRILCFGCGIVYKIIWLFWCGICCCRLCRSKKVSKTAPAKGKAAAKEKAKAKASNEKPASNGAAKAAPTATKKK
mmetsp:Transcript_71723/g.149889  ORF Transcript_71723/g.149889 Transcript_71723/m.149889 type:complete len:229 (-) Transcript_71723:145-831(-)|eukprot:CAMPEP_0206450226 /NCGR_PEP_ID=MMETSP0324_2-20121206/18582_1 /ASSEMBLY_ACC=CAM_ASM_000836 /TAXON_ID=2866 /ORGANISM="Crypthecodinium cohnii, Strain Seligo" /LENGTH=228 /DNA_ID=CAMNT_0053919801 /DNA_START=87 /DNA_END=773 /DNA_ORIENTATION=-